jgi:hypothetical protein
MSSLLLLAVGTGGLGPWGRALLLMWAASGAVALTKVGERVAVRAAYGFGLPSPAQAAMLQPLGRAALRLSAHAGERGRPVRPAGPAPMPLAGAASR